MIEVDDDGEKTYNDRENRLIVYLNTKFSLNDLLHKEFVEDDTGISFLRYGLKFGYPSCCIYQFLNDRVVSIPSVRYRGKVSVIGWKNSYYVPCWDCRLELKKS